MQWFSSARIADTKSIAVNFVARFHARPVVGPSVGLAFLILCAGAFAQSLVERVTWPVGPSGASLGARILFRARSGVPIFVDMARRLLQIDPSERMRCALRVAVYTMVGILLVGAGLVGATAKAERERVAERTEKIAVNEAEHKRIVNEANARIVELAKEGELAWTAGDVSVAQVKMDTAAQVQEATNLAPISSLRCRLANAKVEKLVDNAVVALQNGVIDSAQRNLNDALGVPYADALAKARQISDQIDKLTDAEFLRTAFIDLPEDTWTQFKESGTIPARLASGYEGLDRSAAALAKAQIKEIDATRDNLRLVKLEAERKEREAARLAAASAARRVEEERRRKAMAAAEAAKRETAERQRKSDAEAAAARKSEEEYDATGLVLLLKSVEGKTTQFGGEITGTVVNRRARTLNYAQITFNLYDDSGAQVGSALANINGLEPDGRWNFKATSFGTKFVKYKFSKLTGF